MNDGAADQYVAVSEFFGALASPVRAAIVHLLIDEPRSVGQLCEALDITQPLTSQHLRALRERGLVSAQRVGRNTVYELNDEHVAHVFLDAFIHTQENAHDPDGTH